MNENGLVDDTAPPRGGGGGLLDMSLCGEVRRGPSYPDPVEDKFR